MDQVRTDTLCYWIDFQNCELIARFFVRLDLAHAITGANNNQAHELSLHTIAVFSYEDRLSMHRQSSFHHPT